MRLRRSIWAVSALFLVFSLAGTAAFTQSIQDKPAATPPSSLLLPDQKNWTNLPDSTVLAKVGDEEITLGQFRAIAAILVREAQVDLNRPEARSTLLNTIIENKLFHRAAVASGVDKNPELQTQIQFLREQLVTKTYRDQVATQIAISDKEIKEFYEKEQATLTLPDRLDLFHILYATEDLASAGREKITSGKKTFEQVALEESRDESSKNRGGFVMRVNRGSWVPDIEKVAFAMKEKEISEPVKTPFGWHLIRVENIRKAGIVPLEEAAPFIKTQIGTEKQKVVLQQQLEKLRAETKVEVFADRFLPKPPRKENPQTSQK